MSTNSKGGSYEIGNHEWVFEKAMDLYRLRSFCPVDDGPGLGDPQQVLSAIDGGSANYRGVSQKIFDFKELGQQEFKSSSS